MLHRIKTTALVTAATLAAAFTTLASAQTFPSKPVKIITASSAGSGPDVALRAVAEQLSKKWQQPVIVDNRPGGSGFVAASAFKSAAADGHELLNLDSSQITINPHLFAKLPYDVQRDYEPIRPLLLTDFFVVVSKDSPYKTLGDIVQAARGKPDGVVYGSWSMGSPGHLGALRLQGLQNIRMVHVPYKEMPQLYSAVATQEVQWALGSIASAGPMERSGRVKFIGVAGPKRSALYPDVPSVSENPATKGYEVNAWFGFFAPKGIPTAVRDKIAADVTEALATPELVERYRVFGYSRMDLAPAAFAEQIVKETNAWAKIIADTGLKLE